MPRRGTGARRRNRDRIRREAEAETNLERVSLIGLITLERIVKTNEETSLHVMYMLIALAGYLMVNLVRAVVLAKVLR